MATQQDWATATETDPADGSAPPVPRVGTSGIAAVRGRLLLLLGSLAVGVAAGLLLTGSGFVGIATLAGALLLCGGGFATGVHPTGRLVRRLRQAPAVGLLAVGLVTLLTAFSAGTVFALLVGTALLLADRALARVRQPGARRTVPSRPRSVVPRTRVAEDGSWDDSEQGAWEFEGTPEESDDVPWDPDATLAVSMQDMADLGDADRTVQIRRERSA